MPEQSLELSLKHDVKTGQQVISEVLFCLAPESSQIAIAPNSIRSSLCANGP